MGFMGFSTVDYYINKDFIERGEAARITFFEWSTPLDILSDIYSDIYI